MVDESCWSKHGIKAQQPREGGVAHKHRWKEIPGCAWALQQASWTYKWVDCPPSKTGSTGGGSGGGGSNKTCNHCDTKGHLGKDGWKNNPKNTLDWYKKKAEAAGASVEMMMASVELKQKAVERSYIEANK